MICPICNSVNRELIEADLLNGESFSSIMAKGYGDFTTEQLKIHAVSHMDLGSNKESIASRLALKEADALAETCAKYLDTLRRMSIAIENKIMDVENGDSTFNQAISKSAVDLYISTGTQIRETVKLLAEIERDLKSEDEDGSNVSSLRKLSEAIEKSRRAV